MAWKAYWPDEGETAADARILHPQLWQRILDAEGAARVACEYDYSHRDGWERGMEVSFPIVIIAPDGTETRWNCQHERTIEHRAEEAEEADYG